MKDERIQDEKKRNRRNVKGEDTAAKSGGTAPMTDTRFAEAYNVSSVPKMYEHKYAHINNNPNPPAYTHSELVARACDVPMKHSASKANVSQNGPSPPLRPNPGMRSVQKRKQIQSHW